MKKTIMIVISVLVLIGIIPYIVSVINSTKEVEKTFNLIFTYNGTSFIYNEAPQDFIDAYNNNDIIDVLGDEYTYFLLDDTPQNGKYYIQDYIVNIPNHTMSFLYHSDDVNMDIGFDLIFDDFEITNITDGGADATPKLNTEFTIPIVYLGQTSSPFTLVLDLIPLVLIGLLLGVLYINYRKDSLLD